MAQSGGGEKAKVDEGAAPGADDRYTLEIQPPADAATGKESDSAFSTALPRSVGSSPRQFPDHGVRRVPA